jgi:alkanesulfonate monooxygenase SsuD/methylene tetrahydromethanopterin reductase-like flavin-dependent oxidoreductase (luciferase family)
MRIGVGLPTAVGLEDGSQVVTWSRRAEELGFDSVAVIDRLMAPTYDPLTSLAAAAAVTSRVDLYTSILLSALRPAAVVASQAATVDRISGGRLWLGVGVGSRKPDYDAVDGGFSRRGRCMDDQLASLAGWWTAGEDFGTPGPPPIKAGGPPVLVGGASDAALTRAARLAAGWICGVGGAPAFAAGAERVRQEWSDHDREGRPWLVSVINVALGPDAVALREGFLRWYYGAAPFVDALVANTPTSTGELQDAIAAHQAAGCDEVLLFPCAADVDQLEHIVSVRVA